MKTLLVLLYGLLINSIVQAVLLLASPFFWGSPFPIVDALFWILMCAGFLGAIKSAKERVLTKSTTFEYLLLAINIFLVFLGLGIIGAKFNVPDFVNQYNQHPQTSVEGFAISFLGLSTLFAWFTGKAFDT
jgi:hypothetical protein